MKRFAIVLIVLLVPARLFADLTGTEGLAIDLSSAGAGLDFTIAFDPTEITGGTTWDDAGEASVVWTWNLTAGDPSVTFGNGVVNISSGTLQQGGTAVALSGGAYHDGFSDFIAAEHIDWTGVDFLTGTATGLTANEIVVGATPGGILGNTWASPTIDNDAIDSQHYNADSIDNEHINWADIDNLGDEGAVTLAGLATTVTITDNEATAETNAIIFSSGGDVDGGNMGLESDGDATYTPNTGTIGATEFSGGGAGLTAVDAATGDSATGFFDAGAIEHEYGGLEADVSAYDGFVYVTGGATSAKTQNAGTDVTADLEEEAHAAEHAVSGGDTIFPADPDGDRYLMWDDDPGNLTWDVPAGVGDMTKAVYDAGDSGGVDQLTTVDSTYAADYVLLTGTAVGTDAPKTDGALPYDATTGTLSATQFSGGGAGVTSVDAITGDSATGFFDAGTIEHEYGGLEADVSVWTGMLAVAGGVTTEIDTLDEVEAQLSDVTRIVTEAIMPVAAADPDVDAAGELSVDTDGGNEPNSVSLRSFIGTDDQVVMADALKHFSFSISEPDNIAQADYHPIWQNRTGYTFTITEIHGESDIDDFDFTLKERDEDGQNLVTIEAVQLTTNGTNNYYDTVVFADIDAPSIEAGHTVGFDNSADDATYVTITFSGSFNADVD